MTKYLIPLFLLVVSISILSINVKKPFIGAHDFNGVFFGQIARNYVRYDLETKLGQVVSADVQPKSLWQYHTHHPPLLPLLLAISGVIFGFSEAALRLVPIIFSAFSIVLLYLIGKELFSKTVGFTAAILPLGSPIFVYYAKMPVHEPLVLTFMLLTVWRYLLWVKNKKQADFLLMIFPVLAGLLSGWPFYYLPFALFFYTLLFHRSESRKFLPILVLAPLFIALQLILVKVLTGSYLTGIYDAFLLRFGASIGIFEFIKTEFQYLNAFFGKIILILTAVFLIMVVAKVRMNADFKKHYLILFLGLSGGIHLILARNAAVRHDYLIFLLIPFFALASAVSLSNLARYLTSKVRADYSLALVIIGTIVSAFIGIERLNFTKALIFGEINKPGYLVGHTISKLTASGDKVLFSNREFTEFFGPFVVFYSDRQVDYADVGREYFQKHQKGIEKSYQYLVLDTSRPHDDSLGVILAKEYNYVSNGPYYFYDLKR